MISCTRSGSLVVYLILSNSLYLNSYDLSSFFSYLIFLTNTAIKKNCIALAIRTWFLRPFPIQGLSKAIISFILTYRWTHTTVLIYFLNFANITALSCASNKKLSMPCAALFLDETLIIDPPNVEQVFLIWISILLLKSGWICFTLAISLFRIRNMQGMLAKTKNSFMAISRSSICLVLLTW